MDNPLEDFFEDIITKAQSGLNLSAEDVASRAGISQAEWHQMAAGHFDEDKARKIAPILGLNADALVAAGQQSWSPKVQEIPPALAMFTTSYGEMQVNAYLIQDPDSNHAVIFDTGADCEAMKKFITDHSLEPKLLLITHAHGDHVAQVSALLETFPGVEAHTPEREDVHGVPAFSPGKSFSLGSLNIETRLTWGHSHGGVTYVVHGLERPVAIVGDAIFAGSMGGGRVDYQAALETSREAVFSLPDDTIICPGHGPVTTVGLEKRHNPFFAE